MKDFLKISILLFAITFISCTQTQQTNYNVSIKGHQWKSFDKYEIPITVYENGNYNLYTLFRHNLKYPYTQFEGQLSLIQPTSKDSLHFKIDLNLVDSLGNWSGDLLDDLVSHEIILKQNITLKKGVYQAIFSNDMMDENLKNVLNIGLHIKKSK